MTVQSQSIPQTLSPGTIFQVVVAVPGPDMETGIVLECVGPGVHRVLTKNFMDGSIAEHTTKATLYPDIPYPGQYRNTDATELLAALGHDRLCAAIAKSFPQAVNIEFPPTPQDVIARAQKTRATLVEEAECAEEEGDCGVPGGYDLAEKLNEAVAVIDALLQLVPGETVPDECPDLVTKDNIILNDTPGVVVSDD